MSNIVRIKSDIVAPVTNGVELTEPFLPTQSLTTLVVIRQMEGVLLQALDSPRPEAAMVWAMGCIGRMQERLSGDIGSVSAALRESGTISEDAPDNPSQTIKQLTGMAAANVRLYCENPHKHVWHIKDAVEKAKSSVLWRLPLSLQNRASISGGQISALLGDGGGHSLG